jgi:hypothetical protein
MEATSLVGARVPLLLDASVQVMRLVEEVVEARSLSPPSLSPSTATTRPAGRSGASILKRSGPSSCWQRAPAYRPLRVSVPLPGVFRIPWI